MGTSAVTTALTLTSFRSGSALPAWFGIASGGLSVGLGVANLDSQGPRRAVAAVDVVSGVIALATSATRLVVGSGQAGGFDVNGHAVAPSIDVEDGGRTKMGLRFSF